MVGKDEKPDIRFSGFTDAWKKRKLGEIYTERNERGDDSLQILSVSIQHGISNEELDSNILGKKVRRSEDKTLYKHVYFGDLVLNMMRAWQGALGVVKSEGMVSPAYITAIPNDQLYPLFMDYCLRRDETIIQMNNLSYGVTDFRKRLYWDSFINVICRIPSVPEQERIAAFLTSLDNLISLHQRKYDKLITVKKAMLEKMFPKDGADVPEIRFKGFTGVWKQNKLNYFVETSSEKNIFNSFTKDDVLSVSGKFGVVNQIEFQGRSFAGASVLNYGIVNTGDIVYTKSPLKANPYGIIKTNKGKAGIVSTLYAVYRPKEMTNSSFVQCYFESDYRLNRYLKPLVNKGAKNDMKVTDDNALLGYVIFPSYDEQTKIVRLFEHLACLITLHQRELDKLKTIKKAMLEKMFV